jgi:predicted phage terminase large subunit-like protein
MDYEEKYEQLQALKKLRNNMALFGKHCFPTALKKSTPPFHTNIYRDLADEEKRRVLIAAPRGTAKSTVTTLIYPLWKAAFKTSNEELFIVIISESQAQSINFLSRIKYHLTYSTQFKQIFGDLGPETASKWTHTDIVLANGTRMVAVGTGQRVRGFLQGDTRPNLIIVDDFESELNAYTPEARAKNRKWLTEAVIPSLSDEGKIAMIGTVISEDCFLCWAKESSAWNVLWFSIWDDDEKSIWPERFPKERILGIKEEFKSVGNINGFFQEYMNIAQSPDDAPFQPDWIKIHNWEYKRIDGQNCLVQNYGDEDNEKIKAVELYTGVDPASSLSARADYFVIATIAIDNENNKYVVDIYRDRISPAEQPNKIIETYKKFKPRRIKVETVGYQEALRTAVRELMKEEQLYIPGLEAGVKPRNSKSERLLSLVPLFAKGTFYFRPEDTHAQGEFLSYPKGKHDDIMDAIWTALDKAKPCRIAEFEKVDENNLRNNNKSLDWMTM